MTDPLRVQLFFDDEHLAVPQAGDVISLKILIYPVSNEARFDNEWIKSADFEKRIKIVKIISAGENANNQEVYETLVLGVITGRINPGEEIVTKIGPYPANAQFKTSNNYQQLVEIPKHFKVVETPWSSENWNQFAFYLIPLILFILLVYFSKKIFIRTRFKKREKDFLSNERIEFVNFLRSAGTRADFEKIFLQQKKIHLYFDLFPQRKEFLKIIDQYQYRQSWGDQEINKVKEYRDQLMKEFDRGI